MIEELKALKPANILLPNTSDFTAWATIACDQFTSDINYWNTLKELTKNKLSTLNLVLPEIYLNDNLENRIKSINENIRSYYKNGYFNTLEKGFILTVRSTPFVKKRVGLVATIDLDEYEYSVKSSALIRSTERTIEERIPPRLKIREKAEVEFPHVMVLIDDEKKEILESLYKNRENYQKVYDFDLNMGGGHIEGYFIKDYEEIIEKFGSLLEKERLIKKYSKPDKFLFAVGDGNHSLATAKAHWEKLKDTLSKDELKNHPAKYALCEIVNLYDDGIYFKPIYRFVKGINRQDFISKLKEIDGGIMQIYYGKKEKLKGKCRLADGIINVDSFIKEYIKNNGGKVDYIHGEKDLFALVDNGQDTVGIMFNTLEKKELFSYVSDKGSFPKKTFSMGEGVEKRYYLEGRRIVK